MTKPQTRTCKNKHCKVKFKPKNDGQLVCQFSCSIQYAQQLREKKEKKEGVIRRKKIKVMKEKLKTLSDHKKELQVLVNRFTNLRDKGKDCVSCDTPDIGLKRDASHFWSQGGYPSVRFDLDNIHSACVHCNRDLHGNLLPYRTRIIKRIGIKRFDDLATRAQASNKQTIPEIQDLKRLFKLKIKHYDH